MALALNEDEQMLRETAESYFADKAPVKMLRRLRDMRDDTGFDAGLWRDMGGMGFAGVLVPEVYGGVAMGYQAAGLIAEQMGRNLTAAPFFSTSVLAATALNAGGSDEQKVKHLSKIAAADTVVAFALDEGAKHDPDRIETRAEVSGNGFKLKGVKSMVVDGHVADSLIVTAATNNGLTLFMVDAKVKGVDIERTIMMDSHNAARITLDDVEVDSDDVIGTVDQGMDVLLPVLNAGRAILSAELLGAGSEAFRITVDYIRERRQFGRIIGEFQALQHRASHLYSEMEVARSAVLAALTALDAGDGDVELYCAMTKAKLGQVARLTGLEGIQMHGGVGMTDEYDIGLYLKRIRVLQELFGDGNYHADKVARTKGY
ncbi:MAG: acyl-CoA dehydrogenase family protein [Hyphomonadaceae bacterium]|nr:acyl-CoA dehydrogenase family protein [Hyphomonadaceae bacterium]MBC6413214.1 acyl-CoA dehydrogenase family protein [Hyphomonadaceae bacterium]